MGKRGPKSRLDERMVAQLAKWTEVYGDELLARHKCKISRSTFKLWRDKGLKQKSGIYRDMLNAMEDAREAWEARQVLGIEQAKGWQGKAWLLKNRCPDRYSDAPLSKDAKDEAKAITNTVIYLPDNGRLPRDE